MFSGLGKIMEPYIIGLEREAVTFVLSFPHPVPPPQRDNVQAATGAYGGLQCSFQGGTTHTVVHWDGCGPQVWGEDLVVCGHDTFKQVSMTRER